MDYILEIHNDNKKIARIVIFWSLVATSVLIGITIPSQSFSDEDKALQRLTPLDVLDFDQSTDKIKEAITFVANKTGIDEAGFLELIKCESSLRHSGIYGDSGKAYGALQYHEPTFNHFCEGDYHSLKDQLICSSNMIKQGLGSHWTCIWAYLSN